MGAFPKLLGAVVGGVAVRGIISYIAHCCSPQGLRVTSTQGRSFEPREPVDARLPNRRSKQVFSDAHVPGLRFREGSRQSAARFDPSARLNLCQRRGIGQLY